MSSSQEKLTRPSSGTGSSGAAAASSAPVESSGINHWKAVQKQWQTPVPHIKEKKQGEVRAENINVEMVIERIFAPKGSGDLETNVPLGQMIDILIDFWESDGLYD